jgi:hypothetical protein
MPDNPQHTPGPWQADNDGYIVSANGEDVAEILEANGDIAVIRANARVLVNSPALLEALEDMTQMVEYLAPEKFDDAEHEQEFNARLARARDVIQKTRGEA